MIQEYLFIDDAHREEVEKYAPDKAICEIHDIDNSTCWIVTYSLPKENEDCAKVLSRINNYVVDHFKPTVLTNESSAYYNRKLYPHINEFERKLRKLLYLKSAIYHGEKKIDNIRDLEAKDLGVIFELLFTDTEFVKSVRAKVNEKTWQFTKKEIIEAFQNLSEDTVWNNLLGAGTVTSLSENFLTVKDYRNDVMHAHNIDTETFHEAKKLFADINGQLDSEIGQIIKKAEETPEETSDTAFNETLNTALTAQNASNLLKHAKNSIIEFTSVRPDGMSEFLRQLQEYYASSYDYAQLQTAMKPILDLYSGSEYAQIQKTLREIAAYQNSPEFEAIQSRLRETAALSAAIRNSMGLINPKKQKEETLPEASNSANNAKTPSVEEGNNNA